MKKIICLALAVTMLLSFAACSGGGEAVTDAFGSTVTTTEKHDADELVTINLPVVLIDEEFQNNLDAYALQYGYDSAVLNKDNSNLVTIKMKALSYDLLLTQIGIQVMKQITALSGSDSYPYVVDFSNISEDFRNVTVLVNKKEFEADDTNALLSYNINECLLYYLIYTQTDDYSTEIIIADADTKDVLYTKTYDNKDYFEQ